MRTHRSLFSLSLVTLAAVAACSGAASTDAGGRGPLALGIVSGQNQSVAAGAQQLPAPVVGKLVRKPDGTVAFIQVSANRALDLLVPRAFAQGTVVTGSPVPGAVVCAVSTDSVHKLIPFTPCTNTASDGTATFYFTPGTATGIAKAEIRGSLNNAPAVFDTAKATVTPGPLAWVGQLGNARDTVHVATGGSIDLHTWVTPSRDIYGNQVNVDEFPTPHWVALPPDTSKHSIEDLIADQSAAPTDSGWVVQPPASAGRLYVWFGTQPAATIRRFIQVP